MKKIFFAKLFIVSIIIMFVNNIFHLFDTFPELFKYGDLFFHFSQNILSILSQLASSTAAAIIFYYCVEFLNKNKDLDKYKDFRKDLLFIFYSFLEETKNIEGFELFKHRQIKPGDMFTYHDVPIFIDLIQSSNKETLINSIVSYLKKLEYSDMDKFIKSLNYQIVKLKNHTNYRYIKDSSERIESIINIYDSELDISVGFYESIIKYSSNINEDIGNFINELIENYFYVLDDLMFLYKNTDKFIKSIEKRHIWTFITLLD